ncbi:hypothetical protein GCM10010177_63940 [Actinomadura citrea]|nr:hypothetical protein GCM10010177_63940 [Actinomadura citrea]
MRTNQTPAILALRWAASTGGPGARDLIVFTWLSTTRNDPRPIAGIVVENHVERVLSPPAGGRFKPSFGRRKGGRQAPRPQGCGAAVRGVGLGDIGPVR